MKIALAFRFFTKEGGIGRYMVELAQHLVKEHEVHLLTTAYNQEIEGLHVHKGKIISEPFSMQILSNAIKNEIVLRRLDKKYDFDIVNGQSAELFNMDVVTMQSCHAAWVKQYIKEKNRKFTIRPADWVALALEKHNVYKGSKKIIAMSNLMKNEVLQNFDVPEEKIAVIYHSTNTEEFHPRNKQLFRNKIRERYGLKDDDFILSFVGWEFDRKGLEYIIRAISLLRKDIKLLVIGGDNPTRYIDLARKSGVEKNIIFAGTTPEVRKYYASSDAFVFPTRYEPFGLVIAEAMATGIPVITSKIAGAAELMRDGYDGLLLKNPTDASEIADKIKFLFENEKLRKEIGKNARKTLENYSWDKVARKTMDVFEEVARR